MQKYTNKLNVIIGYYDDEIICRCMVLPLIIFILILSKDFIVKTLLLLFPTTWETRPDNNKRAFPFNPVWETKPALFNEYPSLLMPIY